MAGDGGFDWRPVLGAASAALTQYDAARTAGKQRRELDVGVGNVAQIQNQADALLGEEIGRLATSNPYEARVNAESQYVQALNTARAAPGVSLAPNVGGSRFQQDMIASNRAGTNYGRTNAGLLARIDSQTRMREAEGQRFGRLGSKLQTLGRNADTERFIAELRARQVRGNPWAKILAGIGTNVARNYERGGGEQDDGLEYIDTSKYKTIPLRG